MASGDLAVEARDLAEQLGKGILDMDKSVPSAELVQRLLRVAHTLKGAARVVKQIAMLHGWEVECVPNGEKGAVFRVSRLEAIPSNQS